MKFFIDTANIAEIKEANAMGMVDGVTTNPTLIAKEGREFKEIITEICSIVDGPISAEVISLDTDGIRLDGKPIAYEALGPAIEARTSDGRTNTVVVMPDDEVILASVVDVLDVAKGIDCRVAQHPVRVGDHTDCLRCG